MINSKVSREGNKMIENLTETDLERESKIKLKTTKHETFNSETKWKWREMSEWTKLEEYWSTELKLSTAFIENAPFIGFRKIPLELENREKMSSFLSSV